MKYRFNTYDIICGVTELQSLLGHRVNQIYDVDNKTYLIRLTGGSDNRKTVLLLESGIRFHTTAFEWPKGMIPSGFSMKLRKHLKNKRLERIEQLGVDRIVFFQFGSGEAAYYIILELYDKGNIILTDHEFTILYLLWPHTVGEEIRYAIREKYPMDRVRINAPPIPSMDELQEMIISKTKSGDNLRGTLMNLTCCGPTVIQHVLLKHNLDSCYISLKDEGETAPEMNANVSDKKKNKKNARNIQKGRPFDFDHDLEPLMKALQESHEMVDIARKTVSKGYIVQQKEQRPSINEADSEHYYQNTEFISFLFCQYADKMIVTFDTFMLAVDDFFSKMEGQKIDVRAMQQEREALKKLSNVREDHAKRLETLQETQDLDKRKAELIMAHHNDVQQIILIFQSAIASQKSWQEMQQLVDFARMNNDPLVNKIDSFDLKRNYIILKLQNENEDEDDISDKEEFEIEDEEDCDENSHEDVKQNQKKAKGKNKKASQEYNKPLTIEIDLRLTAFANARNYYDHKKMAAKKVQKTIDASQKALKSAEKKTQQTLKEVKRISTIFKARKVYWFEKFYWFISSENYLVIGGRDAAQNEMIVKRYMRNNDIYVHAEIQGASSVVIRNDMNTEVPPKTLVEAGTMAISYSVAWDAKVATNAYWVYSHQVSKTAPTGEFLSSGSFMIRGKKNFLPPCQLIMGISLLFKLEDSFVDMHRDERKIRTFGDDNIENAKKEKVRLEREILESVDEEEKEDSCAQDLEQLNLNRENLEETVQSNDDINFNQVVTERTDCEYPDTEIKVDHGTGRIMLRHESQTEEEPNLINNVNVSSCVQKLLSSAPDDETTIISAMPARQKQQQSSKKRKEEKKLLAKDKKMVKQNEEQHEVVRKRAQKGKLKKIKEKYKDQTEEERLLRLRILQNENLINVVSNTEEIKSSVEMPSLLQNIIKRDMAERNERKTNQLKQPTEDDELDEDDNLEPTGADEELLNSLTGKPFDTDELLFVIPVIAPYLSLQNYKYKVKLIPGSEKRGKAAKKALHVFMSDKQCSFREKDLMKSIKDDILARNIPGKVKLAAPQLQKYKK